MSGHLHLFPGFSLPSTNPTQNKAKVIFIPKTYMQLFVVALFAKVNNNLNVFQVQPYNGIPLSVTRKTVDI